MRKLLALCAALVALAVLVAGCGSDSDSGSTSSGGETASTEEQASGGAAAAETAEANLAELTTEPPAINIPALEKAPPTGVSWTFVTCPLPVCIEVEEGAKEASDALGWQMKVVNQGLTPDTAQAAFNGIAQNPTDAVASTGVLPNSALKKQLEQIADAGAPFVGIAQSDPPGPLMLAALTSPAKVAQDGERLANWVVADSAGEPGETIFVWDPNLVVLAEAPVAYTKAMGELVPDATVTELKVSAADIGTKLPEQVVNALRTHPDAKYVVFQLGEMATGVPAAIKGANLPSDPTLTARVVSTTDMEYIKNGEMASALTEESVEAGWRAVDLFARALNGEEIYSTTPLPEATFITDENLPADISSTYTIPNFQEQFEEAWGK